MKRRGQRESNVISLFAFQDVMAAVIGILFFVVLLMSLDIVSSKTAASSTPPETDEPDIVKLKEETLRRERRVEVLTAKIARVYEKLNLVSSSSRQDIVAELDRLNMSLKNLYSSIEVVERNLVRLSRENRKRQRTEKETMDEAKKIDESLLKIKKRMKNIRHQPRIAFIIDARADQKNPWLIEVGAKRLRVASKDGTGAVIEFKSKTAQERVGLLLKWATGQKAQNHYFVVLVKPSGLKVYEQLITGLKGLGFEIGVDLLPDKWKPF